MEVVMKELSDLTYDFTVRAPRLNVASASRPRDVRARACAGLVGMISSPSSSSSAVTPDQDPLFFVGGHTGSLASDILITLWNGNVSPSSSANHA